MLVPQTLPAAVRAAATAYADRTAVVDGDVRLSWAELQERVRETAAGYAALGVRTGDRVCLWAPNTWQWVVAGLAVSWAGATLVPVNTRYLGPEVADVVSRTGAAVLVLHDGFLGRHQLDEVREAAPDLPAVVRIGGGTAEGTHSLDDLPALGADHVAAVDATAAAVAPDDVADILFTSGTTGRSKGVLTAHRQTIAAAATWSSIGGVTADDRYLVISPFFHSYGYKVGIVTALLTGCALHPVAAFDADAALRLIEDERITMVPGAPAIFHSLLDAPAFAATDTSSLRFANTGAAQVPVALVRRMQAELSFELVLTAFGMTECVVGTMCRPGDPDDVVATTSGRAVDGVETRIVDPETGADRGPGDDGELLLRGPMVMLGYLDDPAATAQAIDADGWLHTGDVGTLDESGHLRITDRLKDMYISGGFNVYPAEVERALAELDGVADSAVVGVPDPRLGEVGRAFVVRRPGSGVTEADVLGFARRRIANFKAPREVVFVDTLPRNAAGKVLKKQLRSST